MTRSNGPALDDMLHLSAPVPRSRASYPLEIISALLLLGIIALLLLGVTSRYVFSLPVIWVDEAASICFLWLSMIGSALAIQRSEHMRLTLITARLNPRAGRFVNTFALLLVLVFLVALIGPAVEYVIGEWAITSVSLNIPVGYRASALVVGLLLMIFMTVGLLVRGSALADVVAGLVTIGVVGGLLWLASPWLENIGYFNIGIFLDCLSS
jgi:TRAP-type C4-dicarboxylate transport system permease small subunit